MRHLELLPCDMLLPFQNGHTPLIMASYWGHVKCVQQLLDSGANVNHQNKVNAKLYTCICSASLVRSLGVKHCSVVLNNNTGRWFSTHSLVGFILCVKLNTHLCKSKDIRAQVKHTTTNN